MPSVFIVNRSAHDYSRAADYGSLIYLSTGPMNRYEVNNMVRQFSIALTNSHPDDYLVMSGLAMMNSIATALFAIKHGRVNFLLFKNGRYVERNIVFPSQ